MANPASLMSHLTDFMRSEAGAVASGKYSANLRCPVPSIQQRIAKLSYELHEEIRKCLENSTISKRLREELER